MHPRNRHQSHYDFPALIQSSPDLAGFISKNRHGNESIDFANPTAVKALNRALLKHFYQIAWDIPDGYLCPPVPGRADYIHHLAELVGGKKAKILDVGVGANLIYPLIGVHEYDWSFVGADIDAGAIQSGERILNLNPHLKSKIELRLQPAAENIFKNVIQAGEYFDLTLCNPPFHASPEEAQEGSRKKWKNLGRISPHFKFPTLNFGGKSNELWCPGGEIAFIEKMVRESVIFQKQCGWFSSLVSKESNVPVILKFLQNAKVRDKKVLEMTQGQKQSRVVAWSFL